MVFSKNYIEYRMYIKQYAHFQDISGGKLRIQGQ